MSGRPSHSSSVSSILVAALCFGCVTPEFVRIDPSRPIALGLDEALLVLQVDSPLPIAQLSLEGLDAGRPIEAGSTLEVVRVPAGLYRWSTFVLSDPDRWGIAYPVDPLDFIDAERLYLDVRAGALNYAGELVVEIEAPSPYRRTIQVRVLNHLAGAIRRLEKESPALLDDFPLVHALERSAADAFLERYTSERERVRARRDRSAGEAGVTGE